MIDATKIGQLMYFMVVAWVAAMRILDNSRGYYILKSGNQPAENPVYSAHGISHNCGCDSLCPALEPDQLQKLMAEHKILE